MATDAQTIGRRLEELAARLEACTMTLRESGGHLVDIGVAPSAVLDALAASSTALEQTLLDVRAVGDDVTHILPELDLAHRYGDKGWPERLVAISARLAEDPTGGTAAWLASWLHAAVDGELSEAARLASAPVALVEGAQWFCDRVVTCTDALRNDSEWLPSVAARCGPWLAYLAAGAPLDATVLLSADDSGLAQALLLRLRILAGGDDAQASLAAARALNDMGPRLARGHLLAVRSLAQRHGGDASAQFGGSADESLAGLEHAGVPGAAELVHRASRTGGSVLAAAREAIGHLAEIVTLERRVATLFEPPPGEFWVAAAERALRERRLDAAEQALDRAETLDGDAKIAAAECRLALATARGISGPALAAPTVQLATTLILGGHTHDAVIRYQEALAHDPDSRVAALGLADALVVAASGRPLHDTRESLERAVALVTGVHEAFGVDPTTSWALQVEALARLDLARAAEPQRAQHLWRSMLTMAAALGYDRHSARRWVVLSQILGAASALRAQEVTTAHAATLADDDSVREQHFIALANVGKFVEAQALLETLPHAGAWRHGAASFMLQRANRPEEALKEAEAAARDEPEEIWIRMVIAEARQLALSPDAANDDWLWLWKRAGMDEFEGLGAAARAALELHYEADATALAEQLATLEANSIDLGEGSFLMGLCRLGSGDGGGVRDLERAVELAATTRNLLDFDLRLEIAEKRGLQVAAARQAIAAELVVTQAHDEVPPAAAAETDVRRVRAVTNLDAVPDAAVAADAADAAVQAVVAWCAVAAGSSDAPDLLRSASEAHPLLTVLADVADELEQPHRDELATSPPLTSTTGSGDVAPEIRLALPSSWFEDVDDPVKEHPFFLRDVLDERSRLRARTHLELPGVRVRAEDGLEPDQLEVSGTAVPIVRCRVVPDSLYCPVAWLQGLPADVRASAEPVNDAWTGEEPLVRLEARAPDVRTAACAWSPTERIARIVGTAFATHRNRALSFERPWRKVVDWLRDDGMRAGAEVVGKLSRRLGSLFDRQSSS